VEQSFHMVPGSVKDQITLYDAKISDTDVKKAAELTGLAKTIEAMRSCEDAVNAEMEA
jgi:ATP-binding cassette subfamily B multidrug efflux pump